MNEGMKSNNHHRRARIEKKIQDWFVYQTNLNCFPISYLHNIADMIRSRQEIIRDVEMMAYHVLMEEAEQKETVCTIAYERDSLIHSFTHSIDSLRNKSDTVYTPTDNANIQKNLPGAGRAGAGYDENIKN